MKAMRSLLCAAAVLITLTAAAETPETPITLDFVHKLIAEREKQLLIEQRAQELYPRRRDTPMRDLNITDGEVREIQRLMKSINVQEILNISAVVTGCACEEGADCTEQVYVVGKYQGRNVGMQLSRRRNLWTFGRVQRWWLDYSALRAREPVMEHTEYEKARGIKLLEFPMCSASPTPETAIAKANIPDAKKK
jgi:hypothetical protein